MQPVPLDLIPLTPFLEPKPAPETPQVLDCLTILFTATCVCSSVITHMSGYQ